ncbi:hypothetical protein NEAUS04_2137 [Nematocida ausubeli]|nr:hypothetical protein NEAUS05_2360 [Nematocida ausubeli]KAI5164345.1 hypothetical protein NEAUS04_2137 [Nematocida ausubeli]
MGILEKNKKRDMSCAQVWDRKSMIRKAIWTVLLVVAASFGIYVLIYLLVIWRESQKDALKSTQLTLRGDREERIWGHENANNYLDADRTSDNKETAETEESSTSSLDVPEEKEKGCTCGRAADVLEDRHLGRSNSTGKLAEYAMDKKNCSNLIVEKKEENLDKNEVYAAIEKYTVEMERLPEMKNAANLAKDAFEEKSREAECGKITTPLEISYAVRRIENKKIAIAKSSLSQDQNPPINTDAILQREENGRRMERAMEDMSQTTKYGRSERTPRSQRDAQDMNKSSFLSKIWFFLAYCFRAMIFPPLWHVTEDVNSLKNKEIADITQKVNNRYGDPFNIKPADNTGFDPEISKKICKITAEIDAID